MIEMDRARDNTFYVHLVQNAAMSPYLESLPTNPAYLFCLRGISVSITVLEDVEIVIALNGSGISKVTNRHNVFSPPVIISSGQEKGEGRD